MDEQAKDRAHRIGQRSEVRVFRFITSTKVEEGILAKATYKKVLDNKIIQAGLFNEHSSDTDRQKKLEELIRKKDDDIMKFILTKKNDDDEDEDEDEEGSKDATEIPTFEQINEMLARSEEELELFNKMDEEMAIREGKEARIEEFKRRKPEVTNWDNVNYRLT